MTVDLSQVNKNQPTSTPAPITQAHFDSRVIGSAVSAATERLYLKSLDDSREITRRASQSTSAIREVL